MSNRDLAKSLIDQIPEGKLFYIISYLQGAAVPDETPNIDTLEAFAELENGDGHRFTGTTEQPFAELMEISNVGTLVQQAIDILRIPDSLPPKNKDHGLNGNLRKTKSLSKAWIQHPIICNLLLIYCQYPNHLHHIERKCYDASSAKTILY